MPFPAICCYWYLSNNKVVLITGYCVTLVTKLPSLDHWNKAERGMNGDVLVVAR